jgi:hypothetical protein
MNTILFYGCFMGQRCGDSRCKGDKNVLDSSNRISSILSSALLDESRKILRNEIARACKSLWNEFLMESLDFSIYELAYDKSFSEPISKPCVSSPA